jgi:xanthine/CO dehydrogenase XdhC/CoxF family maturation factor
MLDIANELHQWPEETALSIAAEIVTARRGEQDCR